MKPKVFFIDPNSYSNLAVYDYSLLAYMKEVDVYMYGSVLYDYKKLNIFKPLFKYNKLKHSITKAFSYIISILKIKNEIRRFKPDIVHIQWLKLMPLDIAFLRWMHKQNIKVVFTAHNLLPHDNGEKYAKSYGVFYKEVDHIIVHTSTTKNELIKTFGISSDKISVIKHGLLDFNFSDEAIVNCVEGIKKQFHTDGKIIFGSYGQQNQYKGSDIIIDVWSKTPTLRDNPSFVLIIDGRGVDIDYTPVLDIPNVRIIKEYMEDCDFQALIRLTDVILLPYRKISQSGILLSSITNSSPVLVSNAGGLSDPLDIAEIGWNIGESSFENLQAAMIRLVDNPEIIQNVKNNKEAFDKVKQAYDWKAISHQTEQLYYSILSNSKII